MFKKYNPIINLLIILSGFILINLKNIYANNDILQIEKLSETNLNQIPGFEDYNLDGFSNIERFGFNNSFYIVMATQDEDNKVKLIVSKSSEESHYSKFTSKEIILDKIHIYSSEREGQNIIDAIGIRVVASNDLLHLLVNVYGKSYLLTSSDGYDWKYDKKLFGVQFINAYDSYGSENTLYLRITDQLRDRTITFYSLDAGKHWQEFNGPCDELDQVLPNQLFCTNRNYELYTLDLTKSNKKWKQADFPKTVSHVLEDDETTLTFDYFNTFYRVDNYFIVVARYHGASDKRYYQKDKALLSRDHGITWEFLNINISFRDLYTEYYIFENFYKLNKNYHLSIYHSDDIPRILDLQLTKDQLDNNLLIDVTHNKAIDHVQYGGLIPGIKDGFYIKNIREIGFAFYRIKD